jgi:hypothetical protein
VVEESISQATRFNSASHDGSSPTAFYRLVNWDRSAARKLDGGRLTSLPTTLN